MAVELTCFNFVSAMKSISSRERNKIRQEELINLIIQLPRDFAVEESADIGSKFAELTSAINFVRAQVTSNTSELLNL